MLIRRLTRTSLKAHAAALLSFLFCLSAQVAFAAPLSGQPLDDALKDDFFVFFHLTESDRIITPTGFCKVTFKPPPRTPFRDLATIHVLLGRQGKIQDMELVMHRDFIDSAKNSVFARDLTKSFIGAAVPAEDRDHVTGLMNEIFFRQTFTLVPIKKLKSDKDNDKGDGSSENPKPTKILKAGEGDLSVGDVIVIGGPGDIPSLPENVSDQYQVFAGKKNKYLEKLSKCTLELINETRDGNSMFVASVKSLRETSDDATAPGDILPIPMTIPTLR